MSEEAKLFLLKDKLESIRKNRRNFKIAGIVLSFILLIMIDQFFYRFGLLIWMVLGGVIIFIIIFGIDMYYSAEEQNILLQIEQMAKS